MHSNKCRPNLQGWLNVIKYKHVQNVLREHLTVNNLTLTSTRGDFKVELI